MTRVFRAQEPPLSPSYITEPAPAYAAASGARGSAGAPAHGRQESRGSARTARGRRGERWPGRPGARAAARRPRRWSEDRAAPRCPLRRRGARFPAARPWRGLLIQPVARAAVRPWSDTSGCDSAKGSMGLDCPGCGRRRLLAVDTAATDAGLAPRRRPPCCQEDRSSGGGLALSGRRGRPSTSVPPRRSSSPLRLTYGRCPGKWRRTSRSRQREPATLPTRSKRVTGGSMHVSHAKGRRGRHRRQARRQEGSGISRRLAVISGGDAVLGGIGYNDPDRVHRQDARRNQSSFLLASWRSPPSRPSTTPGGARRRSQDCCRGHAMSSGAI